MSSIAWEQILRMHICQELPEYGIVKELLRMKIESNILWLTQRALKGDNYVNCNEKQFLTPEANVLLCNEYLLMISSSTIQGLSD